MNGIEVWDTKVANSAYMTGIIGMSVEVKILEIDIFKLKAKVRTDSEEGWTELDKLFLTKEEAEIR